MNAQTSATTPEAQNWSLRYLAYSRAKGAASPEEMLARDSEEYLGGKMAGFMVWIRGKWGEWRATNGIHQDAPMTNADHAAFDAWLGCGEVPA